MSNEIKKHHIYVTASINEPSGNHHIEAAQCGLPILYIESGGIPEYCKGFGMGFTDDFEKKLELMIDNYEQYRAQMKDYPFNSKIMCKDYLGLFTDLIENNNYETGRPNTLFKLIYLTKQKFIKIARDQLYFKIKQIIGNILRKVIRKNG